MEDFVNFSIAKKLKEKGFREPCFGWYHPSGVCIYGSLTLLNANQSDCRGCDYDDLLESHNDDKHVDAPTISQVLKWLREKKNLHITIDIWGRTWGYDIIEFTGGCSLHWTAYREDIKSYEDAALAGIEYVSENLI